MEHKDNFQHFDKLGTGLLLSMFNLHTFYDNKADRYSWFDASGTTVSNGISKDVIFEVKCNNSSITNYECSIITKADFDSLLRLSPADVEPMYVTFTNNITYVFNLRKVLADPSVWYVREVTNKAAEMRNNEVYIQEDWVYFRRKECKTKGYMREIAKGSMNYGININDELRKAKWKY
ncbi:hypothetical protein [Pedobacter sp. CFBP9032]|uniref:hypothetical protein n=1 Tax=Pedobacter sp. CFBP9032 TaxID=3096539 RepID=UPI002A69DE19|nr:hypothetical protein [Pedobacter sp. CFBP9032]MDY0906591.1 hypothetical protein [Pedobacter sp. CFBP9032]